MANDDSAEMVSVRPFHENKLRRTATEQLRDPRVSLEEKERSMDRYIAFHRQTIQANKAAGLYDYKETARFFTDE